MPRKSPPNPIDAILARLMFYSRFGIMLAVVWFFVNRPFGRHVFAALCAMGFATLMLPTEMMFFLRHPILAFGVPFAAGFAAANLGRSRIGTISAWVVLVVLAVAAYRSADADPVTGPWLRSHVEVTRAAKLSRLQNYRFDPTPYGQSVVQAIDGVHVHGVIGIKGPATPASARLTAAG
jgi:hypothetical protein